MESAHAFPSHPVPRRSYRVFVSYVRADDQEREHALTHWAKDVVSQCALELGESIEVFIDRESVVAGSKFPEAIRHEVDSADIFMAILTQQYPTRDWCRAELQSFKDAAGRRSLTANNLYLVGVDGGSTDVLKQLDIPSIQIAIDIGKPIAGSVEKAASLLADMLRPLAPRQTLGPLHLSATQPAAEDNETYQYISAFDSVRSQRDSGGHAQQTAMVDLRAKLSYLTGYTVVVSETHAFDSLGAIYTMSEASRAWRQQPGPIVPFRIAYFRKPKPHIVDVAHAKFDEVAAGKVFDFSAWRMHARNREGGTSIATSLRDARAFAGCWEHFLEAARFVSWFPCRRLAETAPVSLDIYLRHIVETHARTTTAASTSRLAHDICEAMKQTRTPGNRTALYQGADGMAGWQSTQIEAVKDVVDVAYNRTVADSVLHAAASDRHDRSICLTDPTPDLRASGFDDVVASVLGYHGAGHPESHGYGHFDGAWEGRVEGGSAPALGWADVFAITSDPEWIQRRAAVIASKRSRPGAAEWQKRMLDLLSWIELQRPENVVLDPKAGSFALRAHGFEAGIGRRPVSETGVLAHGSA